MLQVLKMAPGLTQLEIVPFKVAAYNKKEHKMTFFDEQHKEDFEFISGENSISCVCKSLNLAEFKRQSSRGNFCSNKYIVQWFACIM